MIEDFHRLRWASLVEGDDAYHLARHASFPRTSPLHTHDFVEVFWVESGEATHDLNGQLRRLRVGDLGWVRPGDAHRYRGPTSDFAIANLAFPSEILDELHRRYPSLSPAIWGGAEPWRLPPVQLGRLRELTALLADATARRIHLDLLLLELMVATEGTTRWGTALPVWLADAFRDWRNDPTAMQDGVAGLARLGGRSREHVSRVVKQTTGRRAIDLVNELRIETAAARLRMSNESIGRIAADVGLANLSHFYRLFKRRIGTTPRRYRLQHREFVVPSVIDPPS